MVTQAMQDWEVARRLNNASWRRAGRGCYATDKTDPGAASFLMFARTQGPPMLVGGIGFDRQPGPDPELSCWIARDQWNQGYATEGTRAALEIAFEGLRLPCLTVAHFIDDSASARVLEKLGFTPTGKIVPRPCPARERQVDSIIYKLTREAWQTQRMQPNLMPPFSASPMHADMMVA